MDSNLIVGIAGLFLSVLTYFAGVQRTKKQLDKQEKDISTQVVLDRYLDFRKTDKTSGPDGLRRAGVATLQSNDEIRAVIAKIVHHGEKHPLGANHEVFDSVDLKQFFVWAAEKGVNFHAVRLDKLLEQFQSDV